MLICVYPAGGNWGRLNLMKIEFAVTEVLIFQCYIGTIHYYIKWPMLIYPGLQSERISITSNFGAFTGFSRK
jgi:hypothetical protein